MMIFRPRRPQCVSPCLEGLSVERGRVPRRLPVLIVCLYFSESPVDFVYTARPIAVRLVGHSSDVRQAPRFSPFRRATLGITATCVG